MILDAALAGLLLLTIGYCWRLSKKVSALNSSRKELQNIIKEFDRAITKADTSITSLKTLSQEADEQLKRHIEKARFLTNDLAFLTHKGDSIADRLEGGIASPKLSGTRQQIKTPGKPQLSHTSSISTTSSAKKKLQETQQKPKQNDLGWKNVDKSASINSRSVPKNAPKKEMTESKKKALEEVLEQIAARKKKLPEQSGDNKATETHTSATQDI